MGPAFRLEGPPEDWYADPVWAEVHPGGRLVAGGPAVRLRVRGMPALVTPPWAVQVAAAGVDLEAWAAQPEPWKVVDAPPGLPTPECIPPGGWFLQRHTRMLAVHPEGAAAAVPAHRRKQLGRAARAGLVVESGVPVDELLRLHQTARHRKGIPSDARALASLLTAVSASPWARCCGVRDEQGTWIAAAVFLCERDRWIYAFGGAERSDRSGLATVALLGHALDEAARAGAEQFDFGGSSDPGVDRFYQEFGAEAVPKWRWVHAAPWSLPWMRWMRPDLVRGGRPR